MQIPDQIRRYVLQRDNWTCQYCWRSFANASRSQRGKQLSVDHMIPDCRGGTDDEANLVAACTRCNGEKAQRTVLEWHYGLPTRYAVGEPRSIGQILNFLQHANT